MLAQGGATVTVYDAMPSAGRKFLMAGRGGLNLTHSDRCRIPRALPRGDAAFDRRHRGVSTAGVARLERGAGAGNLCRLQRPGIPKAFKASPLLRAWLRRLDSMGVRLALRHRWTGWDEQGHLRFQAPDGPHATETHATVLPLGGASWPRLGSDGTWAEMLAAKGVQISPLRPANSGFTVPWSDIFRDRFEAQPLKGVALNIRCASRPRRGHRYPNRYRRRRGLCAVGRVARNPLSVQVR